MPTLKRRQGRNRGDQQWPICLATVALGLIFLAVGFLSLTSITAETDHAEQAASEASKPFTGRGLGRRGSVVGNGLTERQLVEGVIHAAVGASTQRQDASELQLFCEQHFGMDWVRRWNATAVQVCSATKALQEEAGIALGGTGPTRTSTVTCRSMNDSHMPTASSPHVLCDATNVLLDPGKLVVQVPCNKLRSYHDLSIDRGMELCLQRKAHCPRHRPGYLCKFPTYHHYARGAWAVGCEWPNFNLRSFSKDHQQDIFESMLTGSQSVAASQQEAPAVEQVPTLLVTREVLEHANVFHTFTDLLNVYISLLVMGWEHSARQVVILDNHPPGPLDIVWPVVAAGGSTAALRALKEHDQAKIHAWDVRLQGGHAGIGGADHGRLLVRRASEIQGPILFRHAVFVPPGYTSLLFAHLYEDSSCPLATTLLSGFRAFLLTSFGLQASSSHTAGRTTGGGSSAPLTVRLISRRPSSPRARMARQIGNEQALVEALQLLARSVSGSIAISVSVTDFAKLTVDQQLAEIQRTDILVGMHGAALAYALLLPPHAALVELWPQADGVWRCYQNFAQWAGVLYRRVANGDPSRHRETPRGDITEVDVEAVVQSIGELLPLVQQRRAQQAGIEQAMLSV